MSKDSIVYTVMKHDDQFQAIVRLNALEGQPEYAGEPCGNMRDAHSAPTQRL